MGPISAGSNQCRPRATTRWGSPKVYSLGLARGDLAAAVRAATDHEFSEQQWLMKTDDFKEGVRAVSERRAGDFKGR